MEAKMLMEHKLRFLSVVEIEVFSMVECVANVLVYLENEETLNDLLVERNLARCLEENYLSQVCNHFTLNLVTFTLSDFMYR